MDWIDSLQTGEKSKLWAGFKRATEREIAAVQIAISRTLPADFQWFYTRIGYGHWPRSNGGNIYSPDEILQTIGAPIYFILGGLVPGKEWATRDQHMQLWVSKGKANPAPGKFSAAALAYFGANLTDLLQIGTDGSAGYQMMHLASPSPIGYMVIPESGEPEFVSASFKEGIMRITDWLIAEDDA